MNLNFGAGFSTLCRGKRAHNLSRRSDDPEVDNRLPDDLKAAARELVMLPYASATKRRHSARRENLVLLKPYILDAFEKKQTSIGALAEVLGKFKKAKVSRNYLGQMLALWRGTISRSALETFAPELFDVRLTDAELKALLKTYAAEDQVAAIRRIIDGSPGRGGEAPPGGKAGSQKKTIKKGR